MSRRNRRLRRNYGTPSQSAEILQSLLTGAALEPVAGWAGLLALGSGKGADAVKKVQDMGYQPINQDTIDTLQTIGEYMKPVEEWLRKPGDIAMETTGNAGVATALHILPEMAEYLIPGGYLAKKALPRNYPNIPSSGPGGKQKGIIGYKKMAEPNNPPKPKGIQTEFTKRMDIAQKNAALPVEEGGLGLPPNNTAIDRMITMGFEDDWYHGTTHDIKEFMGPDAPTANKEGFFGAGTYVTDNPIDASDNYAGIGPDLTNKIEYRTEQLVNEMDDFSDLPIEDIYYQAKEQAIKELKGVHDGAVMPLVVRSENPARLVDNNPTYISYDAPDVNDFMDDAIDELGPRDDYMDLNDYDDAVRNRAYELAMEDAAYRDPEGPLADMADSMRFNDDVNYGDASEPFMEVLQDNDIYPGMDEPVKLLNLVEDYRAKFPEIEDINGNLITNDVLAKSIEDAGFTSILMNASSAFPHMSGMDLPTQHQILRDPSRIRSRFAAFDPKRKNSKDILASLAAALVIPTLLNQQEEMK